MFIHHYGYGVGMDLGISSDLLVIKRESGRKFLRWNDCIKTVIVYEKVRKDKWKL